MFTRARGPFSEQDSNKSRRIYVLDWAKRDYKNKKRDIKNYSIEYLEVYISVFVS